MCELPSVYACEKPRARKEHKCVGCRGKISVGEVYFNHHGIWDGVGCTFKVCADCAELFETFNEDVSPECGIAFEELADAVFEARDDRVTRFLDIRRKRGSKIQDWMLGRENEIKLMKEAGKK